MGSLVSKYNSCENISINNYLNDDCLIAIFQHLSFEDRLKVEYVCQRWNALSKQSWRNVHRLQIDNEFLQHVSSIKAKTRFILNCLERSSDYLNEFCIYCSHIKSNFTYHQILEKIVNSCQNLKDLSLSNLPCTINSDECYDEKLKLLFQRNSKLEKIYLNNVVLKGDCFREINANSVKNITISYMMIRDMNGFYDFISGAKNINILQILECPMHPLRLLEALIKSKCENLSELSISDPDLLSSTNMTDSERFPEFLSKQKNLHTLILPEMYIKDDAQVKNLKENPIETLNLGFDEDVSISAFLSIIQLKKLKNFKFGIMNLTDESIGILSELLNLESLEIFVKETYSLTPAGERCFTKFKSLTKFLYEFSGTSEHPCSNNLFKCVIECKKLKHVDIHGLVISDISLSRITSLPNLEILNILHADSGFSEERIIELISKSSKLKKIRISRYN